MCHWRLAAFLIELAFGPLVVSSTIDTVSQSPAAKEARSLTRGNHANVPSAGSIDFEGCHSFTIDEGETFSTSGGWKRIQGIKSYVVVTEDITDDTNTYSSSKTNVEKRKLVLDIDAYLALAGISSFSEQEEMCNACRQAKSFCIPLEKTFVDSPGSTTLYNIDGSAGLSVSWDHAWDWSLTAQENMGAWYGLPQALNCEQCLLAGCYPMWENREKNPFYETLIDYMNNAKGDNTASFQYKGGYTYGNDFSYMARNVFGQDFDEWAETTTEVMINSCKQEQSTVSVNSRNAFFGDSLCSSDSLCALCKYGFGGDFDLQYIDEYFQDTFDGIRSVNNECASIDGTDYYVGWSCSRSGYGVQRSVFADGDCLYPLSDVEYGSIAAADDVDDFEKAIGLMELSSTINKGISCDKVTPTIGSGIEILYGIDENGENVNLETALAQDGSTSESSYQVSLVQGSMYNIHRPKPNTVCSMLSSGAFKTATTDASQCKYTSNLRDGTENADTLFEVDLDAVESGDLATLCRALQTPYGRADGNKELRRNTPSIEAQSKWKEMYALLIVALALVAILMALCTVVASLQRRAGQESRRTMIMTVKRILSESDQATSLASSSCSTITYDSSESREWTENQVVRTRNPKSIDVGPPINEKLTSEIEQPEAATPNIPKFSTYRNLAPMEENDDSSDESGSTWNPPIHQVACSIRDETSPTDRQIITSVDVHQSGTTSTAAHDVSLDSHAQPSMEDIENASNDAGIPPNVTECTTDLSAALNQLLGPDFVEPQEVPSALTEASELTTTAPTLENELSCRSTSDDDEMPDWFSSERV